MSQLLINEYRAELDRLRQITGSTRETNLRPAFARLLRAWGKQALDLVYVEEHQIRTGMGTLISVDGALLHSLRVPFGYWEAKDAKDDLDREIADKLRKGYPRDNIIFSDDVTAVLYQDGGEVARAAMQTDEGGLLALLERFFAHERQEIAEFNQAMKQFAIDLPAILGALRDRIAEKHAQSRDFAAAVQAFVKHAQDAINPAVGEDDVREMLIQHILTEDIFAKVFDNPDYHRHNNVAAELKKLEDKLFGYGEKAQLLRGLARYYNGIQQTAALIESHSEKQGFLKALYEDFYKAYNRKAADRLGVVYTPGEIVRFMIHSADWLCEKHFGKNLIDPGVEILDPATGTGTFIVELLEHFRGGDNAKLRHKYKEELHANEVAILPYYVANLNIEATYQAITGQFAEFENLCLVDTLDNVAALGIYAGHQFNMFGAITDENVERIKRQNRRKISVIIGNPPYNAWQESFNQNNANRPYARVDERIKQTYIEEGTAQNKNSVYDMYARFVRWASDRLGEEGIIAFVIGRKPISKAAFDGFRKVVAREFSEIWLMDLGGDVRDNPTIAGTTHNVFGIQTGVMVALLVRRRGVRGAAIRYARRPERELRGEKLSFLHSVGSVEHLDTTTIRPDARHDWLDQQIEGWQHFLPLVDPASKTDARSGSTKAIFKIVSNGLKSQRDEWVYDRDRKALIAKARFLVATYEKARVDANHPDRNQIKWDRELERYRVKRVVKTFQKQQIVEAQFRPFTREWLYFDRHFNGMTYQLASMFKGDANQTIALLGIASSNELAVYAVNRVFDLGLVKAGNGGTQGVSRYRYTNSGERVDNITDWALGKFVAHYGKRAGVTRDAIFHYVYAVLHDPVYREKYALNLKREFPRNPFYPDFAQWAAWGEALMAMHIGYEEVAPWPIERIDTPNPKRAEGTAPRPKLKSQPEAGVVVVDEDTQLSGIPPEAWDYRLGNRSAIDWVLDQHKEKKPRDPTIAAKFNTYRFADYKERMIDLLARVVRVSVDTVAITRAMRVLDRADWEDG